MSSLDELRSAITDIADAVRAKTGSTEKLGLKDIPNEISKICSRGEWW